MLSARGEGAHEQSLESARRARVLVVKGYMSNPWHRLRPLPAAVFIVRRRYLIEVLSPLPATPLVVHRTTLWPLRRCALRVLNRGAQADARPAVRAKITPVKKGAIR
jgi:hypothetical protein